MQTNSGNAQDIVIKLRILNSIDKPVSSMTVNDICRNAGISRQTFYNHFDNKFSIASWWSEYCEQFYMNRIGFDYSWEEGTLRHLRILFSKNKVLGIALGGGNFENLIPTINRRRDIMFDSLKRRGVEIDELLKYCVETFAEEGTRAATNLITSYSEKTQSLVMATKKLVAITPAPLYDALQLPEYAQYSQSENIARVEQIALSILDEPMEDLFY